MRLLKFVVFFIIIEFQLNAQLPTLDWSYKVGDSSQHTEGQFIITDLIGNTYVVGLFYGIVDFDPSSGVFNLEEHNFNGDLFIQKLNQQGEFLWAKNIGAAIEPTSVIVDSENNLVVAGRFFGIIDFDPSSSVNNLTSVGYDDSFIAKYNFDGLYLWANSYGSIGSDKGGKLLTFDDNSILFAFKNNTNALTSSHANYKNDIVFKKINSLGAEIWTQTIAGTGQCGVNAIKKGVSDNLYITGAFTKEITMNFGADEIQFSSNNSSSTNYDMFIAKLDFSGNIIWGKQIAGQQNEFGSDLTIDLSENIYLTGSFSGNVDFDPGLQVVQLEAGIASPEAFILKLNAEGNFEWAFDVTSVNNYFGQSIGKTIEYGGDGFLYNAGEFSGHGDFDPSINQDIIYTIPSTTQTFIRKLDTSGNAIWVYRTSGDRHCKARSLSIDEFSDIYFTGSFNGNVNLNEQNSTNETIYAESSNAFVAKLIQSDIASLDHLNDNDEEPSFYPNPVIDFLTIDLKNFENEVELTINDVKGGEILNKQLMNTSKIELDLALRPGVYFVHLNIKNKMAKTFKLLKL